MFKCANCGHKWTPAELGWRVAEGRHYCPNCTSESVPAPGTVNELASAASTTEGLASDALNTDQETKKPRTSWNALGHPLWLVAAYVVPFAYGLTVDNPPGYLGRSRVLAVEEVVFSIASDIGFAFPFFTISFVLPLILFVWSKETRHWIAPASAILSVVLVLFVWYFASPS
jgi:hypothetical protein